MSLPAREPWVIFQKLADGAVLFSPRTEMYFGLNAVGTRVWEMLPPEAPGTLEGIVDALGREYPDVPAPTIRADVLDLLADLTRERLVAQAPPPADGAPAP